MNSSEVLKKLPEYKKLEGRFFLYKDSKIKISKIVAAPYNLNEFTKHYTDYIKNSESMVSMNLTSKYDIYFFQKPFDSAAWFIRLDDFLTNCVEIY